MRNTRKICRAAIAAVCLLQGAEKAFADTTVTWAPATQSYVGDWSTASNWNPMVVPNNNGASNYAVVLPDLGNYSIILDIPATIDSLTMGAGANLVPYYSFTVTGNVSTTQSGIDAEGGISTVDGTVSGNGNITASPNGVFDISAIANTLSILALGGTVSLTMGPST
jgi:hypothetical protein